MSYTKKLLVSSALAFASFSQIAIGSQAITETLTPQGHVRFVQQQETSHLPKLENVQGFQPTKTLQPLSAWDIMSLFVTSFFEPFIQDAPKVLAVLKEQKKELAKQGVQEYASNAMAKVGEFVIENPLDAVMLVGSAAMGWNVADTTLVPLAVYSASGLKNSRMIWSLAHSIGNDKELLKLGIYGLALAYAAATIVPAVDAALTPTLGAPFQIEQNSINSNINSPLNPNITYIRSSITGLTNGNFVVSWLNSFRPTIIGRVFSPNGTAITDEFTIGHRKFTLVKGTSVANLTDGNFFVTWIGRDNRTTYYQGTLVPFQSITGRIYYPNGDPFANSFTIASCNGDWCPFDGHALSTPIATGLKNGKVFVSWGVSDGAHYKRFILGRIVSPAGLPITGQFQLNQDNDPICASVSAPHTVVGLADGNALAVWSRSEWCKSGKIEDAAYMGRIISPNGTFAGDEFTIGRHPIKLIDGYYAGDNRHIAGAGLMDRSAFLIYQKSNGVFGRIIKNGVPSGNEFFIGNGLAGSVTALTDNSALATWASHNGDRYDINGILFNSVRIPLTNQFTIAPAVSFASHSTCLTRGGTIIVQYQNISQENNLLFNGRGVSFNASMELTPSSWLTFPFVAAAEYFANWWR